MKNRNIAQTIPKLNQENQKNTCHQMGASLGLPTNPQKISLTKFNTKKKSHAEFPSHKSFQKSLN